MTDSITITMRMENIRILTEQVKAHCMCFQFDDQDSHYFVTYPAGFRYGGCRVSTGMGKTKALETLLEKMEMHWKLG